jgi:ribonuclease E
MPNKMLIDATHPEETRVVVLRGQRVEEFDFESASRKQLRGNIYLAKVTRVEPSLQAAFVDYGGNRHGFLAFSEIHPDYYQIPVADRQALIAEEERAQRAAEAEVDHRVSRRAHRRGGPRDEIKSERFAAEVERENGGEADYGDETAAMAACSERMAEQAGEAETPIGDAAAAEEASTAGIAEAQDSAAVNLQEIPIELPQLEASGAAEPIPGESTDTPPGANHSEDAQDEPASTGLGATETSETVPLPAVANITEVNDGESDDEVVESVGGGADAMEEVPERMPRVRRQYKIQEVIKRRQVMLVQVVKEERGTKGAALTTYLSLAGRYCVLMPNTARGGGISRKITSVEDRRRLKEIAQDLEVPEGMGVILRTAGAARTKIEVKRDFEYLLRMWETVRDLTLKSTAPKLVYEEGSLVKRSIRDLYNKEIDEILVAGESAFREAKDFMGMLMPSHAKNVKLYRDNLPIFTRHGIESQLDAMFTPVMQLRSGGYIVINQAEALVAIDVNSGRATREHHIEDTALKTNLEAAEEIARQLRLRDLAGLIVIDFIDMDEKRNNRAVERRLKECLRHDRARIQVGHISHFGLLEMSRQRIRSSVLESSTEKCSHCGGTGHVRSVASVALQLLRSLDEMLLKGATHNLTVRTRSEVALYLLNYKRAHLRALEERFRIVIVINADASVDGQVSFLIERGDQVHSLEEAKALAAQPLPPLPLEDESEADAFEDEDEEDATDLDDATAAPGEEAPPALADREEDDDEDQPGAEPQEQVPGRKRRRRRRGRRGGEGRDEGGSQPESPAPALMHEEPAEFAADEQAADVEPLVGGEVANGADAAADANGDGERRRRRRGRRGGRRNRHDRQPEASPDTDGFATHSGYADTHVPMHERVETLAPAAPEPDSGTAEERQPDLPAPSAAPGPEPSPSATEREPAPTRSSVREPAFASARDETAEPAPSSPSAPPSHEPGISTSAESERSERPRRAGWWSRRLLDRH